MPRFTKMIKSEWFKYGPDRLEALKGAIKSGNPVSSYEGKDLDIRNSPENIQTINDYIKNEGPAPTFELELKNGSIIRSNDIGKSPIFGGKGEGGGATGNTSAGESLQCLYLAAMLGESRGHEKDFSYFTPELLKSYMSDVKVDVTYEKMITAANSWHYSAYVSGRYLIDKGYIKPGHILHRGSPEMKKIYQMKKSSLQKSGRALNDDKWNPGDIWAIQRALRPEDVLNDTSIESLNSSVLKAFKSRKIVAISLKQIDSLKKNARSEEYNTSGNLEVEPHTFKGVKLMSDRSTFWASKMGMVLFDQGKKMDMRAPRARGAINVEIQGKGARGGRAGYGEIQYAANTYLGVKLKDNMILINEADQLVAGVNPRLLEDFYKMVKSVHPTIKKDEFVSGLEVAKVDSIHANLAVAYIASALLKSPTKNRNEFVTYLVNYAGSKLPISSAYVKISSGV
jgi:hypothetical protein